MLYKLCNYPYQKCRVFLSVQAFFLEKFQRKRKGVCMVKKRDMPVSGELAVAHVEKIYPHSVTVKLDEYDQEAFIHISEIASGWVKDIKKYVKENQSVVIKIISIDENKLNASIKRVSREQEKDKIKEFRMDMRAEKLLELAGKALNKNLEQSYKEAGFTLQEKFGSLFKGFKTSIDNEKLLIERGVPEKWVKLISEIAKKNIGQKEIVFKKFINLKCYKEDGLNDIKRLLKIVEDSCITVSYISAPVYMMEFKGKPKSGDKEFHSKLNAAEKLADEMEIEWKENGKSM